MTIPNFKEKLQKYAELIVKVGVNVQPNQPVVLYINVEQQELAHLIVKEAYAAGASEVMIKWSDTFTSRQFLEFANQERLENIPDYLVKEAEYIADNKAARISVISEDPIAAWKKHDETLRTKADWLNKEQFKALHYTSPITDITVGLPKNHIWEGAGSYNAAGIEFMANMPTEEVFTAPDARHIDGYVGSTKPLSYAGNIIENMHFEFENGKVTKVTADKGQNILEELIKTDDGATSLGEVSLVPDPSPISQSGITFFNTLFDENASNHMALGAAYPFSIQGGTKMLDEELKEHGINISQTHVDFMMGSADMDIDGIKEDGTVIPIFRNGDWA